ncbi:MAG: DUF6562 domain-containing protein [Candidatus Egerieousia sp.]
MKNFFKSLAICALAALTFASCQKENADGNMDDQSSVVSINLTSPLMGTKAFADGNTVDVVHVHVYKVGENDALTYIAPGTSTNVTPSQNVPMTNGSATYSTRLVTGQTYTFVFWAEKSGNGHYKYNSDTKTIAVKYTNAAGNAAAGNDAAGNDETRDAFYAVLKNVTINGAYSASVALKRPFAQINFGASDYDAAVAAGNTVTGASVKLTGIANSINLLDGTVSGRETVTFANAECPTDPNETLTAAGVNYKYVAMDYVLVGKDGKTLSDVTLTLAATGTLSTTPEYTYTSVPLQGNYRTNIVGNLFTSPASINITVDSNFEGDNNEVIQNVSSIAAANTALASGATNINISNITASEASATTLQMPATPESITVSIESIESTANLTIEKPATGSNPASVAVTIPPTANVNQLTINLPESHVEINGASYTSITATTSNNTLVIGEDVTVETLTIKAGAVEIYGEVGTLTKGTNAGDVKVWAVGDKANFTEAYNAGAKTIELKNNIEDFSSVIEINRDLTIDGKGFEIWNTANRVIRVTESSASTLNITFKNLGIISKCTAPSDVRGISFDDNCPPSSVVFDACKVSASFYAINLTPGSHGHNITIKNATVAAGWAAINCYANNSTFNIENSILKGLNDKGESSWNNFATIVFDGNGLNNAANIGVNGTGNTLNVVNSTIYACSESSNNQAWLAIQYGAKKNRINVDSETIIKDYAGNDQTRNVVVDAIVGYNSTTHTYTYYDHESEIWFNGQNVFPGMYQEEGKYHIINASGLRYFEEKVNTFGINFSGKNVVLDTDIDLNNVAWNPVGQTGATQFLGTFDGQDHTINNLTVTNDSENGNCASGLFGWLNSAVVKNIKISGATISGHHNVGTIAGYLETAGCTIENCHVAGATISCTSVNDDANGDKCGGIVGYAGNKGVLVKGCTVTNSSISAGRDAGQVVGAAPVVNVVNCSATNVTVTANGTSTGANIRNEVIGKEL